MNIYSSVDGNNIDKIIVLFNSVLINADSEKKDQLKFYLLVDKLPNKLPFIPDEISSILEIKELELNTVWRNTLNQFNENFYKRSSWCKSDMNFARFLFFNHFPEVKRAVYLDWDMIVITNIFKLEEEYNNYDNMIVANCGKQTILTNIFKPEFSLKSDELVVKSAVARQENIKIKSIFTFLDLDNTFYKVNGFNAGFYIVSDKHFEEIYLLELLRKLIKIQVKFKCFNFGTQVVMNLMSISNRTFVDNKWNHLPNIDDLYSLNIIHWNGTVKPWNSDLSTNKIWIDYYTKIYPKIIYQSTSKDVLDNNKSNISIKQNIHIITKKNNLIKRNNLIKLLNSKYKD